MGAAGTDVVGNIDCSSESRVLALLPEQSSVDEDERSVAFVDRRFVVAASTVGLVRSGELQLVEVAQTAEVENTVVAESTAEAANEVVGVAGTLLCVVLSVLLLGQIHPLSCHRRGKWFFD